VTFVDRINAALKKPRAMTGKYTHRIGASAGGKTRAQPDALKTKETSPGIYKIC